MLRFSSLKSRVYEKNQVELKFNVNMFLKCKKALTLQNLKHFVKRIKYLNCHYLI